MTSGRTATARGEGTINVLFTCVGRRVSLIRAFQRAAKEMGLTFTAVGADANALSAGLYVCDRAVVVLPLTDEGYVDRLLQVVKECRIDLVVPTIDPELKLLARHKDDFEKAGARVLVSSLEVISICQDKRRTYRFLVENGFDTPWTKEPSELQVEKLAFPIFLKPWNGSASKGSTVIRNREEYDYHIQRVPNGLIQECIIGQEYTCDVYVDFGGEVRCVVPRRRIEVRGGEVSKGQTECHLTMMDTCRKLVQRLKAGPGVITIQCFLTADDKIKFIEINPRFGGGVPLSIQAGADFPKWVLSEMMGRQTEMAFDGWQDGLYMLRYDEAVWVAGDKVVR